MRRHLQSIAVRAGRPVHIPQPHLSPDLPPDGVVLQQVAFLLRHAGHAGLETAEHILVFKSTRHRVHGGQQQRQYRLIQNVTAAADIGRDVITAEHRLQQRAVYLHVPGRHAHIPPAHALPGKPPELGRHILHLGERRVGLIQPNGRLPAVPYLRLAEAVTFQMSQRRAGCADKVFRFTVCAVILCHSLQPVTLADGVLKQLHLVHIPQQRHRQAVGLMQHRGQNILLHPVEIGKSVHIHVLARQIVVLRQRIAQLLHPGAHVKAAAVQPRVIGRKHQRRRAQLVPGCAGNVLHLPQQRLRPHLVGVQLVRQRHQLPQERGPLGRPREHRQPPADLLQRPPHGQQLAAGVQRHVRQSAGAAQYTGGQTAEAQHLRITAGRRPAGPAQVQLRLVGGMLRYKQHLSPFAPPCGYLFQHPAALSGAGPAHQDMQLHGCIPLSCSRFTTIVYNIFRPLAKDIAPRRRKKDMPKRALLAIFPVSASDAVRPGSPPSP